MAFTFIYKGPVKRMHRPIEGILGNLIFCCSMNEQYKALNRRPFEVTCLKSQAIADSFGHRS